MIRDDQKQLFHPGRRFNGHGAPNPTKKYPTDRYLPCQEKILANSLLEHDNFILPYEFVFCLI
ncbi:MAG: hypothetical protein D3922_16150 [Candidatus Electrothrix sp. AR1]|nr:hypothetical protein [Candidatus Electrothrix sp. AR1]